MEKNSRLADALHRLGYDLDDEFAKILYRRACEDQNLAEHLYKAAEETERKHRFDSFVEGIDDLARGDHKIGQDTVLYRAIRDAMRRGLDQEVVPAAKYGERVKKERSQGGKESWRLSPEQKAARNKAMQAKIDQLCLEKDMTYNSACDYVGRNLSNIYPPAKDAKASLSFDRVKKLTENPRKKTS